jgi:hypothetical protein
MSSKACNSCGQKFDELIKMAGKLWHGQLLCRDCAQPIIDYLYEYGVLERAGMAHLRPEVELVTVEDRLSSSQAA